MPANIQSVIDAVGEQFRHLDNHVEKWIGLDRQILALLPPIQEQLENRFPENSFPVQAFAKAAQTYQSLLDSIPIKETSANGYLNLRFYIMLNGFLAACNEALEKVVHNSSLNPSELVEKSYYTPYFFERVTYTRQEIIALLDEDIQQLESSNPDQKGVLLALRVRKGTALTLTESYCPLHPRLYPLAAELEQVPVSKDPGVISTILGKLNKIRSAIR